MTRADLRAMFVPGPGGLPPEMIRQVEAAESRALARARDLVEHPTHSPRLLQLQEALRWRSESALIASSILKAYGESARRIVDNLRA